MQFSKTALENRLNRWKAKLKKLELNDPGGNVAVSDRVKNEIVMAKYKIYKLEHEIAKFEN